MTIFNRGFLGSIFTSLAFVLIGHGSSMTYAAEYQWGVPVNPAPDQGSRPNARAFLWIPPDCDRVRAVVVGQHNMLEEDILDHPDFRKAMADLGVAIVWITPAMDGPFDPARSGDRFNTMMKDLAIASGYEELEFAPIAPIGHSAAASYPWNFAAWAPQRTLCALSIHGDAPQTPMAGFGRPNANWGDRTIDGVPGLMVMAEYEWIDGRLAPATVYHFAHPKAPIAMLAEPGEGHFAACDDLVHFCAMFIRKSVEQRLPPALSTPLNQAPALKPIDPARGWLVQRWTLNLKRTIAPASFEQYAGDAADAFWAFDEEMALAIQNYHAQQIGKLPQLIGFVQSGELLKPTPTHPMVTLRFLPAEDGETFKLQTRFLDAVSDMGAANNVPRKNNHIRWTGLPAGTSIGHAGSGEIELHRIEGPVEQISPDTFRISFYRGASMAHPVFWLYARHPGDEKYKSAVQQAVMEIPRNDSGADQVISFDAPQDQYATAATVVLSAKSSANLPVHFYIREGPAMIVGNVLKVLPIPPRGKLPVKITVVAWQWGRSTEPRIKTAEPVERTFSITQK